MFTLHDKLPTSVEIDGEEYELDMSFDNVLAINEMLNDDELTQAQKVVIGVRMLFVDPPALTLQEYDKVFYETYNEFIGVGKEDVKYDIKGNPMPSASQSSGEISYDVVQDAELIFASFFQYYQMDLHEQMGKLHYHKFRALLNGLGDDTIFQKIIDIRQRELPKGKGTEKQREALIKMKKKYALKKER